MRIPKSFKLFSTTINVLFDNGLEDCLDADWLKAIAGQALTAQGAESGTEMGLVIASLDRVQELNKAYLRKDEPTDVLAFGLLPEAAEEQPFALPPDGIKHLGEVIIAYPQAVKQAREHHHSLKREVAILIVHGILHLLGYDHDAPEPTRRMAAREAAMLDRVEERLE